MESGSKLPDAVGVVGAALESRTSLRSLEETRDGPAGIEARRPLPVCVSSAFVSWEPKAPRTGAAASSHPVRMHKGVPRPSKASVRCVDRSCLASHKPQQAEVCSFASCDLGQSPSKDGSGNRFAPLLPVPGRRTFGGLLEPSSLS